MSFIINSYRFAAPPPPVTSLVLLHADGVDGSIVFTDEAGHTFTPNGGVELDTAQSQFGPSSILFSGSTYLSANDTDLNLSGIDYSFECWIRITGYTGNYGEAMFSTWGGGTPGRIVFIVRSTGVLEAFEQGPGGTPSTQITGVTAVPLNVWNHVVLCRSGTTVRIFLNGTIDASATAAAVTGLTDDFHIGVFDTGGGTFFWNFAGHIDEVELNSFAKYTSNFTPPTVPTPPP